MDIRRRARHRRQSYPILAAQLAEYACPEGPTASYEGDHRAESEISNEGVVGGTGGLVCCLAADVYEVVLLLGKGWGVLLNTSVDQSVLAVHWYG